MPEPVQRQQPVAPLPPVPGGGPGSGPAVPQVTRPNTEELLKRMRKVDPEQAKRYRQRTGE